MNSYNEIINILSNFKTLSSSIAALGKARVKTEDIQLKNYIDRLFSELQSVHTRSKNKPTPVCLEKSTINEVKILLQYCKNAVSTQKPEWQILAEHNGWAPKP